MNSNWGFLFWQVRLKPLIKELQRRRVPRVVALYLGAAFALSQGVQLLQDALRLPGWVLTFVVVVALVGLPIVAFVAWVYDVGRHGVVRTPEASPSAFRWSAAYVALLTIFFTAILAGGWFVLKPRAEAYGPVAVLPLQNRTGDAGLESLGVAAADWITEALVRAALVDVVDIQTSVRAATQNRSEDVLKANTLISGNYYRVGDRLVYNIRIAAKDGKTIQALQPIETSATQPTRGLNDLRDRVLSAVSWYVDRRVSGFEAATGAAPSYQAYESYVEGLQRFNATDHAGAAVAFRRAAQLDTTFLRALLWAAATTSVVSKSESDSLFSVLRTRAGELAPYDRHHLMMWIAVLTNEQERAYSEAHAMMKASPGSSDAVKEVAISALRTGRIEEAIKMLKRVAAMSDLPSQWPEYYTDLANAYLWQGDDSKARQAVQEGRARFATPYWLSFRGEIAAMQGDLAAALAAGDSLLQQAPGRLVSNVAEALYTAGAQREAMRLWRANVPLAKTPAQRVWSLYWLGEYDRALAALDSVPAGAQTIYSSVWPALRGLIAARRGDRKRAYAALDSLRPPTWHVDYNYRARIFAVLGEKDSAVANLSAVWYANVHTSPDLLPLRGYPPFERKLQIR